MLSIGVIAASLFTSPQITKPATPMLISKDNAIRTSIKAENLDLTLTDKRVEVTLLHVKQNGFSFVVDQNTLQDTLTLNDDPLPQYENQYLWKIEFNGSGDTVNGYWVIIINAETGQALMQA
jgi:hypothetical protein